MLYIVCRWWGGCHAMWAKASSNRWSSRRSPSNESLSYCWIFLHAFRFIFCFVCYILFPVSFINNLNRKETRSSPFEIVSRCEMQKKIKEMPKNEFQKTQRRVDQFQVLIVGPKLQNRLFRLIRLNYFFYSRIITFDGQPVCCWPHSTLNDLWIWFISVLESSLRQSKVSYINMPCLKPIYYTVFQTSWKTG